MDHRSERKRLSFPFSIATIAEPSWIIRTDFTAAEKKFATSNEVSWKIRVISIEDWNHIIRLAPRTLGVSQLRLL